MEFVTTAFIPPCGSGNHGPKRRTFQPVRKVLLVVSCLMLGAAPSYADDGGISFWLPGLFGSLAAVPGVPGWAFASIYVHPSAKAGAGTTFIRGGQFVAGVTGRETFLLTGQPTYLLRLCSADKPPSACSMSADGTGHPYLRRSPVRWGTRFQGQNQSLTSLGDLLPQASLKWNYGVNNFMVYGTGDIPVGDYDKTRLANLGIGHGAIDGGGGYTYFNPANGL